MSKPVYAIAERARLAMAQAARKARFSFDNGIESHGIWHRITLEQAREMYWSEVRKILREAHVEVDPNRSVAIQCANCKKVEMTPGDVKVFRCPCSPNEEQWTHKCRFVDLKEA